MITHAVMLVLDALWPWVGGILPHLILLAAVVLRLIEFL